VKGEATVYPRAGESFDPVLISKAIHDAGFTATEVNVVANGALIAKDGSLELNVPGLKHPFVLAGGAQLDALKGANLVGKQIRVTGRVITARAGSPPTLTVEAFQPSHSGKP